MRKALFVILVAGLLVPEEASAGDRARRSVTRSSRSRSVSRAVSKRPVHRTAPQRSVSRQSYPSPRQSRWSAPRYEAPRMNWGRSSCGGRSSYSHSHRSSRRTSIDIDFRWYGGGGGVWVEPAPPVPMFAGYGPSYMMSGGPIYGQPAAPVVMEQHVNVVTPQPAMAVPTEFPPTPTEPPPCASSRPMTHVEVVRPESPTLPSQSQPPPPPLPPPVFKETDRRYHQHGGNKGKLDWIEGVENGRPVKIWYKDNGKEEKRVYGEIEVDFDD